MAKKNRKTRRLRKKGKDSPKQSKESFDNLLAHYIKIYEMTAKFVKSPDPEFVIEAVRGFTDVNSKSMYYWLFVMGSIERMQNPSPKTAALIESFGAVAEDLEVSLQEARRRFADKAEVISVLDDMDRLLAEALEKVGKDHGFI